MEWIRFSGLERAYGARVVFEGVSGVLRDGSKVGLVGPNGAGKSSLVRILAGFEEPDAGTLARAREGRLGYLRQAVSGDGGAGTPRAIASSGSRSVVSRLVPVTAAAAATGSSPSWKTVVPAAIGGPGVNT